MQPELLQSRAMTSLDKAVNATLYYLTVVWHYFKQAFKAKALFPFCSRTFQETIVIHNHCREMAGVMAKRKYLILVKLPENGNYSNVKLNML